MSSYHNCFILAKQTKQRYVHSSDLMHTLCKQRSSYLIQSQNYKERPSASPLKQKVSNSKPLQNKLFCQQTRNNFYKLFLIAILHRDHRNDLFFLLFFFFQFQFTFHILFGLLIPFSRGLPKVNF